jgi:serologically defined colon cancer antigen 8
LTKTVFRLHAETVDRKDELSELKAKYEAELAAAATASQKKKSIDTSQKEVQNYREKH